MKTVTFPNGSTVPALGQGTWGMGEGISPADIEADSLRAGLDLGLKLIDTAEMYGNGGSERVVGKALVGRRDDAFVVSKVLPSHASRKGTIEACERSLKNLKIEKIDLYLLHWQSSVPLSETVEALEKLVTQGKIGAWGVSNFDTALMENLAEIAAKGHIATNQILYNLSRRGPEFDLIPWCENHNIPVMAYAPIEQGRIMKDRDLLDIAGKLNVAPSVLALAWVIRNPLMIAIPKTSSIKHLRENAKALDLSLDHDVLRALDKIFLPPTRKQPLEVI
ncbi:MULTISPECIES: aldo/keto reductase [Bartonella]|uniref:aldo/keto reductase n=1 Tax=Bartonella TaxID=773 RepID=UPI0018DC592B|nr:MULTISPECIES: aldo/keto reductase [Bartonella]MBH9995170.1 aldo/keto reductase [Bartonella sp. P0291]MBH9996485.1 aldo/keto reductase [Bartonella sp. M0192]MBH9998646.1 aldo/keto reductase [Bartonella sp. M0191]MBI0008212.1 aldo/keto reductase [Bartonella sp. M0193]MBI0009936.1 aldo/keto reductase [Bartonella sp. M0176]